jgi:hypothetical protein
LAQENGGTGMSAYVRLFSCRHMPRVPLRAVRANHVFYTDEKHIHIENMVLDKNQDGLGWVLSKIADCARTAFCPCKIEALKNSVD